MGELMIGFKTAPLELIHPMTEEFRGPGLGGVRPEVVEGFLQQMGFEEPAVDAQQCVQGFSGLAPHMSPSGQENELLAGQKPPKAPRRFPQFLFANIVEGLQKMLDDMKLVIDDFSLRAIGKDTVSKGFPHVDDPMSDASSTILPKPLPELRQMPFFSAFSNEQKLWPPGSFQDTDQVPVALSLPHCNLIDAHNRDPIQGPRGLHRFHGKFIEGFHRSPMQGLKDCRCLDGHNLTQLGDQRCQGLADPAPSATKDNGSKVNPQSGQ